VHSRKYVQCRRHFDIKLVWIKRTSLKLSARENNFATVLEICLQKQVIREL